MSEALRLHIGGTEPKAGWKILNVAAGPHVDFVGSLTDLGAFPDDGVAEVYASHVLEHIALSEAGPALRGILRVLAPGGRLMVCVPDMPTLCRLYNDPRTDKDQRLRLTAVIYGSHSDPWDVHHMGYDEELLGTMLRDAGFRRIRRVPGFGLFNDASRLHYLGEPISLCVQAQKSNA